ncbi:hypothetical protein cand_022740 [Cryptosporidium andersoni]|uniref:Dynamin N-terminal domain-containing protein n=1 Tax=Cryptosporidium andersoni TaxID=117008 RepID=A0A1J4MU12_9CRYT|nr:hypothetical protein cand_022740 [Cryptosporidium andersoni]
MQELIDLPQLDITHEDVLRVKGLLDQMQSNQEASASLLYIQCFEFLKLANLSDQIPRIVVIGQQSMGKTTLLDSLIGYPLGYSSSDIGTCCPIVFHIYAKSPRSALNSPISCHTDSTSSSDIDKLALNVETIDCIIDDEIIEFDTLPEIIAKKTLEKNGVVDSNEINIKIKSEKSVNMILVDLPGLKENTREGAALTQQIVREYVNKHPNDIYILVKRSLDDPANWSWKQKEFILNDLGLGCDQTITVGTKGLEYATEEIKEVSTADELIERIEKRKIGYNNDKWNSLPLYILEFFSLSKEERSLKNMKLRREAMYRNINDGNIKLQAILGEFCKDTDPLTRQAVFNYFSYDLFQREVNLKFVKIFLRQLDLLESMFKKYLNSMQVNESTHFTNDNVVNFSFLWKENIQFTVRCFIEIVNEIVTGNFNIFEYDGDKFLEEYGGKLWDNLKDGSDMASKLFHNSYKISFLKELDSDLGGRECWVRHKKSSNILGRTFIISDPRSNSKKETFDIEFLYQKKSGEISFHKKNIPNEQLIPLSKIKASLANVNKQYWYSDVRSDNWIGLKEVNIKNIDDEIFVVIDGVEKIIEASSNLYLDITWNEVYSGDFDGKERDQNDNIQYTAYKSLYNLLILNEMSFTAIFRWFKDELSAMKPYQCFSKQTLCQMLRSVSNVIDMTQWQPLVVDILQLNIYKQIIPLINLVSCSSAVALKRVMIAAIHVLKREARDDIAMSMLFKSPIFGIEFETAIDEYCTEKAKLCSSAMCDLILEQTYAINIDSNQNEAQYLNSGSIYDFAARKFAELTQLLIAPLNTKLYLHFVHDVKEVRIRHNKMPNVEQFLCQKLLSSTNGHEELEKKFNLSTIVKENKEQYTKQQFIRKYCSCALKIIKLVKLKFKEEQITQ